MMRSDQIRGMYKKSLVYARCLVVIMILLLTFLLIRASITMGQELVKLPDGEVMGFLKKSYNNKTYLAFEGIPYAKPPVADLRFMKSVAVDPWEGIIYANKTYLCPQYNSLPFIATGPLGSEDCLYMNVYVPGSKISEDKKEVVVHIHGGAFILGSPSLLARSDYVMNKDFLYVTFNYRLGILGFLSDGDIIPGNNGLKDQVLALQWVQKNIEYFGGNKDSVTLTGLSAGAASVHLHYLSPMSKGLFHRGYSLSGTALNPWVFTENPKQKYNSILKTLNCTENPLPCLRSTPIKNLVSSMKTLQPFAGIIPVAPFGPIIEPQNTNAFLSENPWKLLNEGKLSNDVPLIISTVRDEGIYPVGVFSLFQKLDELEEKWAEIYPILLEMNETLPENADRKEILKKIDREYLKGGFDTKDLVKLFTHRYFHIQIQQAVEMHAKVAKAPVFFYFYEYQTTQFNYFPRVNGVAHSDDSRLLFSLIISPSHLSESDAQTMALLTNLLENYSKSSVGNAEWLSVEPGKKLRGLRIRSGNDCKMEEFDDLAPKEFWKSLEIQENENYKGV